MVLLLFFLLITVFQVRLRLFTYFPPSPHLQWTIFASYVFRNFFKAKQCGRQKLSSTDDVLFT